MGTRPSSTLTPTGLHLPTTWPSAPKLLPCGEREGKARDGRDERDGSDGMGWDGMGWDRMGWDGMGWDGMGWDGMDGMERMERMGWAAPGLRASRAGQGRAGQAVFCSERRPRRHVIIIPGSSKRQVSWAAHLTYPML